MQDVCPHTLTSSGLLRSDFTQYVCTQCACVRLFLLTHSWRWCPEAETQNGCHSDFEHWQPIKIHPDFKALQHLKCQEINDWLCFCQTWTILYCYECIPMLVLWNVHKRALFVMFTNYNKAHLKGQLTQK